VVTTVRKWGNSLALRLPRAIAAEVRVDEGASVEMRVEKNAIVIRPVRRQRVSLTALLQRVTRDNIHSELVVGPPVGREGW